MKNLKEIRVEKMPKDEIVESSGNLYTDLNYKNPEEIQAKAELAYEIYLIIKSKKFTQIKVAKLLGLTQPKVSNLMNGLLRGFSTEKLMRFLNILDYDVNIMVKPKPRTRKQAHIAVTSSSCHGHTQSLPIAARNRD